MTFRIPKSHFLGKPNQNKQKIAQGNYSSIAVAGQKSPKHFVESFQFIAVISKFVFIPQFLA